MEQINSTNAAADAKMAQQRFELENEILDEEIIYNFDEAEVDKLFDTKPWKKDENYFKNVKISATALIKMVMHTKSGGEIEVMGMMQGKILGNTLWVLDSFAMPVEATETRVNASADGNEYMISHTEDSERVNRPENIVGWYHSHPSYGCWLSGIDVSTQTMYQTQGPFVAIVIDPMRTMSAGKVEIGCFRTYSAAHVKKIEEQMEKDGGGKGSFQVPIDKIKEMGSHYHKYYQLEHSFFKSSLDNVILDRLWNNYWVATLCSSPLLSNQGEITKSVLDINQKIQQASTASGNAKKQLANQDVLPAMGIDQRHPGKMGSRKGPRNPAMQNIFDSAARGDPSMNIGFEEGGLMQENRARSSAMSTGLSKDVQEQIQGLEKDSSQIACECNHALMIESLKKFMFTKEEV